jgi:hypothetical protein
VAVVSHSSHRLTGRHRSQADSLDIRRILPCRYVFWCTGREGPGRDRMPHPIQIVPAGNGPVNPG